MKRTRYSGFTLIEILVVISIIGILSSILYASFSKGREDARNKALQTELREVQLALELYKAQNGKYPDAASVGGACSGTIMGVAWAQSTQCGATPIISGLIPDFISELPTHTDSANSVCNIIYQVDAANNSWYKLTAERCHAGATGVADGIKPDDPFARCPNIPACDLTAGSCKSDEPAYYESYAVYSSGGECR